MSRKYRAVVIDGRKVIKNAAAAMIGIAAASVIIFTAKLSGIKIGNAQPQSKSESTVWATAKAAVSKLFDPWNTISGEFAFLKYKTEEDETKTVFNESGADKKATLEKTGIVVGLSGELPIQAIDSSQKSVIGTDKNKILIKNETSYQVNTQELLAESLSFDMNGAGPKVLIVHTHGSESYTSENTDFYIQGTGDRNTDTEFNVVHVGDEMTKVFEAAGVEVIHDRTMHDQPSYNGSYASSLAAIQKYVEEYPSIQVVLDIHRDAIVYGDGTKAKVVTEINGKETAQLMFVVGTNAGGLTHDNWRENLKFAVKLQNAINKKYPSLMRGINLRRERFNGHMTRGSLIIEVGTSGNTLEEAVRGATLAAGVIADFLNGI